MRYANTEALPCVMGMSQHPPQRARQSASDIQSTDRSSLPSFSTPANGSPRANIRTAAEQAEVDKEVASGAVFAAESKESRKSQSPDRAASRASRSASPKKDEAAKSKYDIMRKKGEGIQEVPKCSTDSSLNRASDGDHEIGPRKKKRAASSNEDSSNSSRKRQKQDHARPEAAAESVANATADNEGEAVARGAIAKNEEFESRKARLESLVARRHEREASKAGSSALKRKTRRAEPNSSDGEQGTSKRAKKESAPKEEPLREKKIMPARRTAGKQQVKRKTEKKLPNKEAQKKITPAKPVQKYEGTMNRTRAFKHGEDAPTRFPPQDKSSLKNTPPQQSTGGSKAQQYPSGTVPRSTISRPTGALGVASRNTTSSHRGSSNAPLSTSATSSTTTNARSVAPGARFGARAYRPTGQGARAPASAGGSGRSGPPAGSNNASKKCRLNTLLQDIETGRK